MDQWENQIKPKNLNQKPNQIKPKSNLNQMKGHC